MTYGTCDFYGFTKFIGEKKMTAYGNTAVELRGENDADKENDNDDDSDQAGADPDGMGKGYLPETLKRRLHYDRQGEQEIMSLWDDLKSDGGVNLPLTRMFDVEAPMARNAAGEHSFVFPARDRVSGSKVVLKLVPMSFAEAQNNIAEW